MNRQRDIGGRFAKRRVGLRQLAFGLDHRQPDIGDVGRHLMAAGSGCEFNLVAWLSVRVTAKEV